LNHFHHRLHETVSSWIHELFFSKCVWYSFEIGRLQIIGSMKRRLNRSVIECEMCVRMKLPELGGEGLERRAWRRIFHLSDEAFSFVLLFISIYSVVISLYSSAIPSSVVCVFHSHRPQYCILLFICSQRFLKNKNKWHCLKNLIFSLLNYTFKFFPLNLIPNSVPDYCMIALFF
jgi:hypothetical protein